MVIGLFGWVWLEASRQSFQAVEGHARRAVNFTGSPELLLMREVFHAGCALLVWRELLFVRFWRQSLSRYSFRSRKNWAPPEAVFVAVNSPPTLLTGLVTFTQSDAPTAGFCCSL